MTVSKKFALTVAAIAACLFIEIQPADAFGGRLFNRCRCRRASRAFLDAGRAPLPSVAENKLGPQTAGGFVRRATQAAPTSQPGHNCDGCCLVNPVEPGVDEEFAPGLDAPTDEPKANDDLSAIERELVAEAIRVRGRVLAIDRLCCQRSRYNSDAQASYCRLGHYTGDANEIAGVGYGSARAAIQGWLNSPAHRAILLRANYSKVGAAVRQGRDGRLYWTMNFSY